MIFVMLTGFSALAQNEVTNSLSSSLIQKGFENVAVKQAGKEVYIFFEDRRYRWDPEGIQVVFKEAKAAIKDSSRIHLIPMHHRTPITIVSGNSYDSPDYSIHFRTDSVKSIFREARPKNSSLGKIDIILLPGFRVQFGNYDHPVEWQVSLSPILQTSLWKGMLLSAKVFVPLHSELQQNEENQVRLGTVAINQLFRLPKDFFFNLSTGVFTYPVRISSSLDYQRYGFNGDLRKYFLNSNLCTGASVGYTGQERFRNGVLDYWPMDRVTYAVYSEYREPKYNLRTKITAGKFLYDDYAVRLDFSRQFKEVSVGFFALKSEFGYNGGFNFSIPIAPRKQLKPALARISMARYFNWEYSATTVHPSAATVETGYDLDDRMRFLHENYLIHELKKSTNYTN
jgi:hypothetical protein